MSDAYLALAKKGKERKTNSRNLGKGQRKIYPRCFFFIFYKKEVLY